jgi:hypothetical protein
VYGFNAEVLRRQELGDQGTQRDIVIDQEDRSGMLLGACALVFQKETSGTILTQFWLGCIPTGSRNSTKHPRGRLA